MIVGDSQWVGQAVTQGHYIELTDFLVSNGIDQTVTPATLQYYGEYPTGSGRYYAYPTEGDANGWAYRKDLFEDEQNMADFEAAYGYPLAVPETWAQLRDIAEFFTRPDDGLYGVAIYTQVDYDAITMGFENVMFSYGADWKDADNNVLGVVNSPEAVAALELYRELYSFAPPGTNNAFFQEMNDAFINGQVAMAMNYFAFFPALDNPTINPFRDGTGYFSMPAGPDGDRYAALGGQGISVNSYISDERKQASLDFIQWFAQEDIQARWAELGGYTCNINVLESEAFLTQTPYNAAFAETMTFVKDFWNIPEFGQLLAPTQQHLQSFVVGGEGTAQEQLDAMAAEHDEILVEAGYLE
jgi:multiple sugar transport system substrate-binding protein